MKDLRNQKHHNIHLQRSWNKYNEVDFQYGILELVDIQNLFTEEQLYLDINTNGYNIAPANGGDIISKHPDRLKIIDIK